MRTARQRKSGRDTDESLMPLRRGGIGIKTEPGSPGITQEERTVNEIATVAPIAPQYQCSVCKKLYPAEAQAITCRDSTEPEVFAPGTIVAIGAGYYWFDGDPEWVLGNDKRPEFIRGREPLRFLFVVTSSGSIPYSPHERAYSVRTLAIENGQKGGMRGWNRPGSHMAMHAVAPELVPDSVQEVAAKFVGETYHDLL